MISNEIGGNGAWHTFTDSNAKVCQNNAKIAEEQILDSVNMILADNAEMVI